jgi:SAM-dependent methyltransferase
MTDWFDDPDFWAGTHSLMFDGPRWERAPEEVEGAVDLLGVGEGAHILDLCCGPGRHSRELRARGFAVTGVDLCEEHVRLARENAPGAEVVRADMREFRREGAFDGAINLYTSFGYFEDIEDDRRVAANLLASLKPGSRAVFELKGKECLARVFEPMRAWEDADGNYLVGRSVIEGPWERCRTKWIRFAPDGPEEFEFVTRVYAATELRALLLGVGFARVDFYGDLAGAPYDHTANRMVAVAIR